MKKFYINYIRSGATWKVELQSASDCIAACDMAAGFCASALRHSSDEHSPDAFKFISVTVEETIVTPKGATVTSTLSA